MIVILTIIGTVLIAALVLLTLFGKCRICNQGTMKRVCDHPENGDLLLFRVEEAWLE